MSTPPAPDEPLQFDEADYGADAPVGLACSACAAPIQDHYYETAGHVVCEPCRGRIEASYQGGSRFGRLAKAAIFGVFAAALGAILYYIIVRATGYNIGLVAIVIGLMVGAAVRSGSGGRGGWAYQLLALFLTYTAVAGMLAPLEFVAFRERRQQEQEQQVEEFKARVKQLADESKREAAEEEAKVQTEAAAEKDAGGGTKPAEAEAANPAQPPADAPAAEQPVAELKKAEPAPADAPAPDPEADEADDMELILEDAAPPTAGEFVLGLLVLGVIIYALPILTVIANPMAGLIFGFALWEAWKINRRSPLVFNGPYHVLPPDAIIHDEEDHDGGREHGA